LSDETDGQIVAAPDQPKPASPTNGLKSRKHKRTRIVIWIASAVAILLLLLLVILYFGKEKKAVPVVPGISITTTTAGKGDIGVYLDAIGTVTPVHTASISSQVSGLVMTVHFKEGQLVKQGDALIDIDPRLYRATLLQAQGALERDENLLAQARMDAERYRKAWAGEAISKQTLDDQEKLVLQDEGIVKNDQGTVQYDQLQVNFCHITAPIDGRVGLRLVDPGNVVQSAGTTTLVVITQLSPITVIFTIPEDSLGQVQAHLGAHAALKVYAFERTAQTIIANGELLTLDNQIDTTTGTVKARAVFDNKNGALFPNQFVNTRLLVNTIQGATLIPTSAIQQNGQASFVYVIQNNIAHMRSITPGVTNGGFTQVTGLNPGEVVADSSFDKLQDNAKVVVAPPPAATPPASAKPAVSGSGSS
jgi:multidrug efflux system membrane fusion protein